MNVTRAYTLVFIVLAMVVLVGCGARPVTLPTATLAGSSGVEGMVEQTTGTADSTADALIAALEGQGLTVGQGSLTKFSLVPLCCAGQTPTCMANNAGAPYMAALIPNAPGQTSDSMLPWLFRLGANEAIVVVAKTPPPAAYFSYEPFANLVHAHGDGEPQILGANIGDSINNLTIRTSGPASDPFERDTIIIVTADQGIDSRVRSAVAAAGLRPDIVNTSVIPASVVRLGVDDGADEFSLVHRIFLPDSQAALEAFMDAPKLALRVTLEDGFIPAPFAAPDLRVRGTGTTEIDLMPAVDALRAAIVDSYPEYTATDLTTSVWLPDGFDGLQRGENLYLPTRDTVYLRTDPVFTLPDTPDDFLVVYGVNHEATGKATYSNLSVYADPSLLLGVTGENSRVLAGSATTYLPDHPQAASLYAWKVARECRGEAQCLEVKLAEPCAKLEINDETELWLAFRIYLEQRTRVGPAFTELIYDRALLFSKPEK